MTWETPVEGGALKTPHTMELPFSLYSFEKVRPTSARGRRPKRMADQIASLRVAFARTGKPDHLRASRTGRRSRPKAAR